MELISRWNQGHPLKQHRFQKIAKALSNNSAIMCHHRFRFARRVDYQLERSNALVGHHTESQKPPDTYPSLRVICVTARCSTILHHPSLVKLILQYCSAGKGDFTTNLCPEVV
ncbi:unnamed protein product [Tuber aestivum]|uniref:Uncharacterized protein n=1 Tax=Tuber aestivum TaxID=59557 RepID=A0A292PZ59_9PEZI|nr:unnamed protein product [Tuber aestivum]